MTERIGETGELRELQGRLQRDVALSAGTAVLVVALGGFLAWASLAPLTEGVVASGSVVVDTAHKTVRHLEGGIVKALHVREGSEVRKGDLLLELSDIRTRAELTSLEHRYFTRLAEIDRLNAEREMQDDIVFSDELTTRRDDPQVADMLAVQQGLFEVRRLHYQGQADILRHRIEQLKEKIRGLEASHSAQRRERALIVKDLESLTALHERKLVEKSVLIARQREREQAAGEIGSITAQLAGTRVAIGEMQQEIIQLAHAFRTDVSDRLGKAQQERFEISERIAAVRDVLQRTRIVAPQDGKVIGLAVHAAGAVVAAASPIMNIVPSEEPLMVEGRVRPTDVDNVAPGQAARLRFAAFNQRETPEIMGDVTRVSPDVFQDGETNEAWYAVRVRVPDQELAKLGNVSIGPGMPVDVMFTGSERTAMQYLSDPLADILRKALVEE